MLTLFAPVEPNRRPAYVRIFDPYETAISKNQEVWFSFLDHTKDNRFSAGGLWLHRQIDYWSYDYQRIYYDMHFIDQKELEKDFSEKFRCTFEVTRLPEFGTLRVVDFMPMYDKLVYTPAIGYEGQDSFTVRPIVPRRGFTGHPFTFKIFIGNENT